MERTSMREFSVSPLTAQAVPGATTLAFINPKAAPNPNLEFLRYWVGQFANATSAQQPIPLETQALVFPTPATITPSPLKPPDPNGSILNPSTTGTTRAARPKPPAAP